MNTMHADKITLTADWRKDINGVFKPSGGIHPDDTDVNIFPTSRVTGLNLWKHVYCNSQSTVYKDDAATRYKVV